jgi:hypothetical protein
VTETPAGPAGAPAAADADDLDRQLADVIAALTDRQPAQAAGAAGSSGPAPAPADDATVTSIRAAFARLRQDLGLPAAGHGHGGPGESGPAQDPPRGDPSDAAHMQEPGLSSAAIANGGFADIRAAFADLRQALGLPAPDHNHNPGGHDDGSSTPEQDGMRRLDDAIAEAQACATWYRDTPEWQRITRVSGAARALMTTIREATGDYWAEIRQDIRVRGFARTVTARACLAIAGAAHVLAGKLEQAGHQKTRPWRAAQGLHRSATSFADRLMRYLPPGDAGRMHDVERIISGLGGPPQNAESRPASHGKGPRTRPASAASPAALAHASFPGPLSQVTAATRNVAPQAAAGAQHSQNSRHPRR